MKYLKQAWILSAVFAAIDIVLLITLQCGIGSPDLYIPFAYAQFPVLTLTCVFYSVDLPVFVWYLLAFLVPLAAGFFWAGIFNLLSYLWWVSLPRDMRDLIESGKA